MVMTLVGTLMEQAVHGQIRGPGKQWGLCGQSCPRCRLAAGESDGLCLECAAAAHPLPMAYTIASFCCFTGETREVRAALSGSLDPRCNRLPPTTVTLIGDLLPKTPLTGAVLVGEGGSYR